MTKNMFKEKYNLDLTEAELAEYMKMSKKIIPLVVGMLIPVAILVFLIFGLLLEALPFDMTTFLPLGIVLAIIVGLANLLTRITQKMEKQFVDRINQGRQGIKEQPLPLESKSIVQGAEPVTAKPRLRAKFGSKKARVKKTDKVRRPTKKAIAVISIIAVASVLVIFIPIVTSPAFSLLGTWRTTESTTHYIRTDFINGYLEDVGSEKREVTWVISLGDQVRVEMTFTYSERSLVGGSGYVPDVSPNFYRGTIEGNILTLHVVNYGPGGGGGQEVVVGIFVFTSNTITGTWNDAWGFYGEINQQTYTAENGLVLLKQ